jgi:hypothetical protein
MESSYTDRVVTPTQRIVGVLALVALMGGPVVATVCAMRCAPARPAAAVASHHGPAATTASASAQHHHDGAGSSHACCTPATRVLASIVAAPGCDTHGTPDRDVLATLTAPRSDTHNPIAMPAAVFDRVSLSPASAQHAPSAHGPPLDTSQTLGARALVLRV